MFRAATGALVLICLLTQPVELVSAAVDTLKGTDDIEDCVIYAWQSCNPEVTDEDCRRYNGGGVYSLGVGHLYADQERRALFRLPGWDGVVPDSSVLRVYCTQQASALGRKVRLYPLTAPFFEGSEASWGFGDYPNPDSGATWLHRYLDDGDADSVNWNSDGGDFTTAVGCTTTITGIGQYFTFQNFNRILTYWDTSGNSYGFILIGEDLGNTTNSSKVIASSEASASTYPMVLLYRPDEAFCLRRSLVIQTSIQRGQQE